MSRQKKSPPDGGLSVGGLAVGGFGFGIGGVDDLLVEGNEIIPHLLVDEEAEVVQDVDPADDLPGRFLFEDLVGGSIDEQGRVLEVGFDIAFLVAESEVLDGFFDLFFFFFAAVIPDRDGVWFFGHRFVLGPQVFFGANVDGQFSLGHQTFRFVLQDLRERLGHVTEFELGRTHVVEPADFLDQGGAFVRESTVLVTTTEREGFAESSHHGVVLYHRGFGQSLNQIGLIHLVFLLRVLYFLG